MKKTVDKIPFYRLGWNKANYLIMYCQLFQLIPDLKSLNYPFIKKCFMH
jgi:hypothetical protein